MKPSILPNNRLTFIIRNEAPLIFCDDSPTYRTVTIILTSEQLDKLKLQYIGEQSNNILYERISKCFLEPKRST